MGVKYPDRDKIVELEELPNIGKVMAEDLRLVGVKTPADLCGKDPLELYHQLCERTGVIQDPCVLDVFIAAVDFMEGGDPKPWWSFSQERKKRFFP